MKRLLPLISICLLLFLSCSRGGSRNPDEKIEKAGEIIHVDNPAEPQHGRKEYTLKEEFSIGEVDDEDGLLVEPTGLTLDRQGNIYVLDFKKVEILKFNSSGKFIKRFARKGQGPGELNLSRSFHLDQESNTLHILDTMNNKIACYTTDGDFIKDIRLIGFGSMDFLMSPEKFYFVFKYFYDEHFNQTYKINKYSLDGALLATSDPFLLTDVKAIRKGNSGTIGATPYHAQAGFACDSRGILYYSLSNAYKFTTYDHNFNKLMEITKHVPERLKLTQETIAQWYAEKNESRKKRGKPAIRNLFQFPDYYPVFKEFWLDDRDRLIVRTYSHDANEHLDVFSADGVYLEEIILHPLPESGGISLSWILWKPIFKNNCIYSLVMNKEDQYIIKKYMMVPVYEK